MHTYLWRLIGATVVCSVWVYVMYQFVGAIGLVLSAPVIGIAFTRLVIDAAAEMGWRARSAVLAPLSGNHYVYMEFNLRVVEDDDFGRWMAMDDVRRIVGNGATDKALAQTYPSGWQVVRWQRAFARRRADALPGPGALQPRRQAAQLGRAQHCLPGPHRAQTPWHLSARPHAGSG